ncbi:unnamed protein product [Vitrella brassicaformis CCMP3155]|uniref:Uncharacterized protein n=1 Tax=Vitrella brassicaformis (strain CCMP3155) TaxID=1169540 RepID=A0A0G4H1M5_VITBC|nr:unnamed protein product [Vitrella brassicaformis CCMP3155]|eukprot:CEM37518.1 unnamed protein product [Vitrella brassicaformis CCMP3155]
MLEQQQRHLHPAFGCAADARGRGRGRGRGLMRGRGGRDRGGIGRGRGRGESFDGDAAGDDTQLEEGQVDGPCKRPRYTSFVDGDSSPTIMRRRPPLLYQLLAPEIRDFETLLLQCFQHFVETDFLTKS